MRPAYDDERISLVEADSVGSESHGDENHRLDPPRPNSDDANPERAASDADDVKYSAQFLVAILKPVETTSHACVVKSFNCCRNDAACRCV